jgi:hypothetical protein
MKNTGPIKYLALALALGAAFGPGISRAQTILEVGGAGVIGDTTLTTAKLPVAGVNWQAPGGDGNTFSSLVSPTKTVLNDGTVILTFTHRHDFEADYDGGAVYVNVNGGGFVKVPLASFTSNGYNDTMSNATVWPLDEEVFTGQSTDYSAPALITSVASLGSLNAGDTVAVEFRGGWDTNTNGANPNWEIATVNIADTGTTLLGADFTADGAAGFTASTTGTGSSPWIYTKPVSRFELDADTLAADRYAPSTAGSVIDLNGANLEVVLLTGTLDPGETFTLFDLSGGTILSGSLGSISLPPGTWDTSKLAVNGTIVCVLPVMPPPPMPVTDGMRVWLSAETVTDIFVKQWNDLSPNGRNATNGTANDQPRYIAKGLNGQPVLRFAQDTEDNGDRLYLGDLSADFPTAGSVFVVATIDNDARYNLFGNRNNDERWVANTWNESRPGSFRQGRSTSANFTLSDWPTTGSHIVALESSGSVYNVLINGTSIGTDTAAYNPGSGVNWTIGNRATNGQQLRGDIAEIILFNRVLTSQEANLVGGYLTQKYGLATVYPPASLAIKLNSPVNALAYPTGMPIEASVTVDEVGTAPFTVEFWVDGALAGTDTTAPYSLNLGILSEGSHSVYAKVIDSSTPTAVTAFSAAHLFTVAPATTTTTTLASSANPSTYGTGTLTATVVAANATALTGGTVQFFDGGSPLGVPVAVNATTGEATLSINTLGAGAHGITAGYSGWGVHAASSSGILSQVVNVAPLTVSANHVFRPAGTANLDPLPYKITGYQNGETRASSGVTGEPLLTTAATSASPAGSYGITCALGTLAASNYSFTLVNGTLTVADVADTFSVNFYVGPDWPYGGLTTDEQKENVKVQPGVPAGFGDWFTNAWLNYLVPWAPTAARPPVTITSNRGSSATFTLIDCRNGWTYAGARTTLLEDGNGNMMDAHVNSTLDPDNGVSNSFKMEMTDIPFAVYDVIFYMGASRDQYGDGKGAIIFNGGSAREFTIKPGAFDGTFTEIVDATTPGNYIVFKGVAGSSFTAQTYGTGTVGGTPGFVHLGPFGFQIRPAPTDYATWAANYPGANLGAPNADYDGDGVSNDNERLFGLDPTDPSSLNPISIPLDAAAGTFSFTRRDDALTGRFSSVETSTDLMMWTKDNGAVLQAGAPDGDGVETVAATLSPGLLSAPKLFIRVAQDDGVVFSSNFEEDDGGFALSGSPNDWAWGTPNSNNGVDLTVTAGNGGSAKCWGTRLGDGAGDGGLITPAADSVLRGPHAAATGIDLTGVTAAELQFAAAVDATVGDTLEVLVKEVGTGTTLVNVPATELAPAVTADWASYGPYDISAAAGKKVYLEFRFRGTDGLYIGLYIDDVTVKQVLAP